MAKMALLSEEFRQDVREFTSTDCTQITKMSVLSAGFRQDVREVTRTDCSLMTKMALLSEEFRQDVREVTRTDCSQIVKMALLSEGFRQDVREVKRTDCSLMAKMWPFCQKSSCRMSEKSREQNETMLTSSNVCEWTGVKKSWVQSDGEDGTFVGRVPTGLLEMSREQTALRLRRWPFCRQGSDSSDRMSKKHEGSPPWENWDFVWRVPTGSRKNAGAVHLEKMAILSEEFRQDVQKSWICFSTLGGQFY